jgi:chloride channel protein, CIC family
MIKVNQRDSGRLGDFTASPRIILISLLALFVGAIGAFVALALLRLIGIFTNLFFFQRWSATLVSPVGNHLGPFVILVPVIGALIVGLMARYGSERIRGHGIPEAIEAILINGSKIQPRVAILKPLSSAISIGSGGPFGAEGPIIMTGGAVGSMIAQCFQLTSTERKTLLVAGAAAGMSATFATPVAAVLLAVELLLFEWKPRSMIPVAIASAIAAILRRYLLGTGPLFPVAPHPLLIDPVALLGCVIVGLLAGGLSALLTVAVYISEDAFKRLPIHWMWWPAIGGVAIGLGGLIFPQALGVGYDTINALLQGNVSIGVIVGILVVKSIIWSFSLGSGTSGGVLAPLLMMGGALGGLESLFLPHVGLGFWPLISMAAILGGTMRSPFTGTIFALELTHDINALLLLMIACVIAYGFTVLVMRRSILTEKVSRRGYHLSREYSTDPLEITFVRDVMRTAFATFSRDMPEQEAVEALSHAYGQHGQHLYPVLDSQQQLVGVLTRGDLHRFFMREEMQPELNGHAPTIDRLMSPDPVLCYPDEPLRVVVSRMAETNLTRLPVVERDSPHKLVGIVSLSNLLKARALNLRDEFSRERVLGLRVLFALWQNSQTARENY